MRVSPESPVKETTSFLHKWDSTSRKYFNHFEIHKQATREGIRRLYKNFLTSGRDPIQYRPRYQDLDLLTKRQLLGDISKQEVAELNNVIGKPHGIYFQKSFKEPAAVNGWNSIQLAGLWALGTGIAAYALLVRKYNILWVAAPYAPLWTYIFYNYSRQPTQHIENAYSYLLAKRAATA